MLHFIKFLSLQTKSAASQFIKSHNAFIQFEKQEAKGSIEKNPYISKPKLKKEELILPCILKP